jgi:TatD DNase family protein
MFVPSFDLMYTDTHTHLYLDTFSTDRDDMVKRAVDAGVTRMFLPNIDSSSIGPMFRLADRYPGICYPMMGLHPTSVKEDYREKLKSIENHLSEKSIIAIGETGMDLYWDRTFRHEQEEVFRIQIGWAKALKLPLVIHARNSFQEIFDILDEEGIQGLHGVFHSFTGSVEELEKALSYGFMIGINGIVTFRNSNLGEVAKAIPTNRLLLETDAPFLAPVPFRGKRNESSYLVEIAAKIAEIHNLRIEEIGEVTSHNADHLFQINPQHES